MIKPYFCPSRHLLPPSEPRFKNRDRVIRPKYGTSASFLADNRNGVLLGGRFFGEYFGRRTLPGWIAARDGMGPPGPALSEDQRRRGRKGGEVGRRKNGQFPDLQHPFLRDCSSAISVAWCSSPSTRAPRSWVRVTRVTYGPHESAPVHQHPQTPTTVYIYTTDGGVMRLHHITDAAAGVSIYRRAVKAGAIRFARGMSETHSVQYLGDVPTEYVRVELRREALDPPATSGFLR